MAEHIDTATVQTLTAEVRVLQVGSRQITQSVAQQLDFVKLRDLTVFGRVHISITGHYGKRVHNPPIVIGADPNGSLALAPYDPNPRLGPFVLREGSVRPIVLCSDTFSTGYSEHRIELRGVEMVLLKGAFSFCPVDHYQIYQPRIPTCEPAIDFGGQEEYLLNLYQQNREYQIEQMQPDIDAANAPLIVLAGLR